MNSASGFSPWSTVSSSKDERPLPLAGLKVIDLTLARAGPTTVRHLADWGADVIRIEPPRAPAGTSENEDVVGRERGSDYQNLHRNKRSLRLNLKEASGKAIFMQLVEEADVVIENMRPSVKHRLGVAYEDLSQINPRLIYGSISGFGQTGPYQERPGLDQVAQAMSGLMSVTGAPEGGPMRTGIAVGDLTAGNLLALNIMMALFQRQSTGRGCWVHTSLLEGLMFMLDFQAARWLVDKDLPERVGNEHPTAVPTDVFTTQDGHIAICAASSRMWSRLCVSLGHPEWVENPQWCTRERRRAHRVELLAAISERIVAESTAHWIDTLNAAGVTCGPIYTIQQAFEDAQIEHLGMQATVEHPVLGPMSVLASPLNFGGLPRQAFRPTPDSGADTDAILHAMGYEDHQIGAFKESGIC